MNKEEIENKIKELKIAMNKSKSIYLRRDYFRAINKLKRKLNEG